MEKGVEGFGYHAGVKVGCKLSTRTSGSRWLGNNLDMVSISGVLVDASEIFEKST